MSLINADQGGMAVSVRPCNMVSRKLSGSLSCRVSGNNSGPKPPFSVMPWQEPQSFRTNLTNSDCRPLLMLTSAQTELGKAHESMAAIRIEAGLTPRFVKANEGNKTLTYNDRTQPTTALNSSSLSLPVFAGMGIGPQTPLPPALTFLTNISCASF